MSGADKAEHITKLEYMPSRLNKPNTMEWNPSPLSSFLDLKVIARLRGVIYRTHSYIQGDSVNSLIRIAFVKNIIKYTDVLEIMLSIKKA